MIILQAVLKLLNTSRLKAPLYISEPSSGQVLHTWYAKLVRTCSPNKMLVMYTHQPSGLTVLVHGKTVQSSFPVFRDRLGKLLLRNGFSQTFIEKELAFIDEGYVVGKTSSRQMLGRMNQLTYIIEEHCRRSNSYETMPLERLEDLVADHIYLHSDNKKYADPLDYFQELGVLTGNAVSGPRQRRW